MVFERPFQFPIQFIILVIKIPFSGSPRFDKHLSCIKKIRKTKTHFFLITNKIEIQTK